MSILASLLGRFGRRFLADFFFDFAPPFARKPGPEKSIKQISQEQNGRHPFVVHDREDENETDDKKSRNRFLCFPIERLETRILKTAEHHEGKKEQQRRQNELPFAEMILTFGQPEQEKGDRRN